LEALRRPGAGKIDELVDVHGVYLDISVLIYDEDEAIRWLSYDRDTTMNIALAKRSNVFRRNHHLHADVCVRIIDQSILRSVAEGWNLTGFDYDGLATPKALSPRIVGRHTLCALPHPTRWPIIAQNKSFEQ
jgi:hypothetical protein